MLAAGRGTRMRAADATPLSADQERWAARGVKALVPFHGRPFLDYVLSSLADAGFTQVCIVVASGLDPLRARYGALHARRLTLTFAEQDEPRGSADALLAARAFAGDEQFALINADNDYPVAALAALRALRGPGLVGFRAAGLLRGNVSADRLGAYALIVADEHGTLRDILEKPGAQRTAAAGPDALISMTCWRFGPAIFEACRRVPRSARGEYELPDAVRALVAAGQRFEIAVSDAPVIDLGRREDVPGAERFLRGRRVQL